MNRDLLSLACSAAAAGLLMISATAACAEPDKPKPKPDQAVVAGQGQAEMASNPQMASGAAATGGGPHVANLKAGGMKAKKTPEASKTAILPYVEKPK